MSRSVFADSFYFFALLSRHDTYHRKAVKISSQITCPIYTTSWILVEVADGFAKKATRSHFLRLMKEIKETSDIVVIPPSIESFEQGLALCAARPDKDWPLTDCISFAAMREHGITEDLTGDRHYEQAGFTALFLS